MPKILYSQMLAVAFGACAMFGLIYWLIAEKLDQAFMFFLFAIICELERLVLKEKE